MKSMKTVMLGKTGLTVSRVGIGGIPILRPPFEEAVKILQLALDLGFNFFDTAVGYGTKERASGVFGSEERIGKAISGRRNHVVVATKTTARDRVSALDHLSLSMKRLNTDYVDLWQFHNISTFAEYERVLGPGGALEAAQEMLEANKVHHIGLSTHSMDIAIKAITSGRFESIQYPFNFINNEAAETLVPLAREHDVGFIAMKPFAGGRLRDAQLALKYLLQFDNVVPDPGVKKVEEVEQIAGIVNGSWDLTSEDHQRMKKIRDEIGTKFCHWCEYCMPCPQNVNIPVLMNAHTIGNYAMSSDSEIIEAMETAKKCVKCGTCEEKCPFHLPIREQIAANIRFLESMRNGENGQMK